MRFVLLATLVTACNTSGGGPLDASGHDAPPSRDFNNCSWRDPKLGESQCRQNDDGTFSCTCDADGSTCTYENFENGCDCGCAAIEDGTLWWGCIPDEPFSSPCPVSPPADAGVQDMG